MNVERRLMTGNEALARGAWEAGVKVATSYPGTPATEITEALFKYPEVNSEWSVNEKVSLEVAIGSCIAGARSICCMKHVGLNVAADPLFTMVYAGVNAGLVIVTADEPGFHSSQNEQDNRLYAKFAQMPMFEPSDAQEAREMAILAFRISEEYDIPVLIRMTTRVCHSRSPVTIGPRVDVPNKPYKKDASKYAMLPHHALVRHHSLEERMALLARFANTWEGNRTEMRSLDVGVVTSGINYQNVREALPDASVLKIGMSYPVPLDLVAEFAKKVDRLYVVEEGRPFLEEEILAHGVQLAERKSRQELIGEISARYLRKKHHGVDKAQHAPFPDLPTRPPQFCPGCGHRGLFFFLSRKNISVQGDIGCYSLGSLPPFNAMDTVICMGASIGMDHGFSKVKGATKRSVSVIGDSTFFHSGMTNLLNAVFNKSGITVIILDNRITAMTGHQQNPAAMEKNVEGNGTGGPLVRIPDICRALGVRHVFEINGYDMDTIEEVTLREIDRPEPSVIVINSRCVFVEKEHPGSPMQVDQEKCKNCRICLKVGCPGLSISREEEIEITDFMCDGCGVCADVCPFDAIYSVEETV